VFVILTDGCIHDMRETLELIIDISFLPASLIIAGIGNEDFRKMSQLNVDTLRDGRGRKAARSVVHFTSND
jgi:hypothetical protein